LIGRVPGLEEGQHHERLHSRRQVTMKRGHRVLLKKQTHGGAEEEKGERENRQEKKREKRIEQREKKGGKKGNKSTPWEVVRCLQNRRL